MRAGGVGLAEAVGEGDGVGDGCVPWPKKLKPVNAIRIKIAAAPNQAFRYLSARII